MLRRIVLVNEEVWQLHDPEVENQVPEYDRVIVQECLLGQDCVAFLRQRVDNSL